MEVKDEPPKITRSKLQDWGFQRGFADYVCR